MTDEIIHGLRNLMLSSAAIARERMQNSFDCLQQNLNNNARGVLIKRVLLHPVKLNLI